MIALDAGERKGLTCTCASCKKADKMSFPLLLIPVGIVCSTVIASGLLAGLIHLLIVLIVLAIVYYILAWVLGALGAPAMITKLVMILCAVIALYFIVIFLLSLAP